MKELVKVVAGDTDSVYLSYKGLLDTIEGIENMTPAQIGTIIARLNTEFLDEHNEKFMTEYYNTRHCDSVHKFELETIAYSECRLDVKKRYAQLLFWKDGKVYDTVDQMPLKVKGLEMIKSSYPKQAREALKRLTRFFLEDDDENFQLQRLNIAMQKERDLWMKANIEDICGSVGVQNYTKYILDDADPLELKIAPKCPFNCKALGNYNRIRQVYNLPGDPLYGGKMKWYLYSPKGSTNKSKLEYFAFQAGSYPKWADTYAPINRSATFQQFVIDPFNRILEAVGLGSLSVDGSIQMGLF